MAQHFDISDVRAQFAYRVALQNKHTALSTLPEKTPDYAGALALDAAFDAPPFVVKKAVTLPAGEFTGNVIGRAHLQPVTVSKWQRVVEALCGVWGRV